MTNDDMIYEESLDHLQAEAAAGADFVITQMVFQAEMLISFIKQCRGLGITVPIIPGILPIQVSMMYYTVNPQISLQGLICKNNFWVGPCLRGGFIQRGHFQSLALSSNVNIIVT